MLERIKATGDIFLAWPDNDWILDGAAVRVSIVGFDDGSQSQKQVNARAVTAINADLTSSTNLISARQLAENEALIARGIETGGPFELTDSEARQFRQIAGYEKVIVPILNGRDVTDRSRNVWIVDFQQTPDVSPSSYEGLYSLIQKRWEIEANDPRKKRPPKLREEWWEFRRSGEKLRSATLPW